MSVAMMNTYLQSCVCLCFATAVFLVDDDLGVSAKDLQFAFRVWKVQTLLTQSLLLLIFVFY